MSEEQQERRKRSEKLLAYLKRRWGDSPISAKAVLFGIGITFAVLIVIRAVDSEWAQFIGYLIGGGLLILQIYVSNRRATAAEDTAKVMQKTAESTEKGNIDERFKNAIEHLGHPSASSRLGGIYALHHIAQEADEHRERVFDILCAHIRETTTHETYKPRIRKSDMEQPTKEIEPTIEIQSILNLLFIKTPERETYEQFEANLENANLVGARLVKANLKKADLENTKLDHANLYGADLWYAKLQGATLQRAKLQTAKLQDANLAEANLLAANLLAANLHRANLQKTDLQETDLQAADLQEAELQKAKLQKAKLQQAKLQKADLQEAELQEAKLQKAKLQNANLLDANLPDAILLGANLLETNLQGADLQGATLRFAKNLHVEQLLVTKTLYRTKLPEGMEQEIREKKPELLQKPSDEEDA